MALAQVTRIESRSCMLYIGQLSSERSERGSNIVRTWSWNVDIRLFYYLTLLGSRINPYDIGNIINCSLNLAYWYLYFCWAESWWGLWKPLSHILLLIGRLGLLWLPSEGKVKAPLSSYSLKFRHFYYLAVLGSLPVLKAENTLVRRNYRCHEVRTVTRSIRA